MVVSNIGKITIVTTFTALATLLMSAFNSALGSFGGESFRVIGGYFG